MAVCGGCRTRNYTNMCAGRACRPRPVDPLPAQQTEATVLLLMLAWEVASVAINLLNTWTRWVQPHDMMQAGRTSVPAAIDCSLSLSFSLSLSLPLCLSLSLSHPPSFFCSRPFLCREHCHRSKATHPSRTRALSTRNTSMPNDAAPQCPKSSRGLCPCRAETGR